MVIYGDLMYWHDVGGQHYGFECACGYVRKYPAKSYDEVRKMWASHVFTEETMK